MSDPRPASREQSSTLDLEHAELTDLGRVRTNNEDYFGHALPDSAERASSHGWLFVLADGVGGHNQGEVASRITVDSVLGGFRAVRAVDSVESLLVRLIKDANAKVCEAGAAAGPAGAGMSTTVVACAVRHDRAYIAHVGDSRCYLIRNGSIRPLTRDHTVANEQFRLGLIAAGQAGPITRHALSRSIGGELFVNVETGIFAVLPGDTLLLCSDGLHGAVPDNKIASTITAAPDLDSAARSLVDLANELSGGDNVTVQLARVRGIERIGIYRGRPYKLR
jgi:PPM family protein phosphatase